MITQNKNERVPVELMYFNALLFKADLDKSEDAYRFKNLLLKHIWEKEVKHIQ